MNNTTSNFEHLYGMKVVDRDGDRVGEVKDIYLDDDTGKTSFVTLNGNAGRHRAVPTEYLEEEGDRLVLPLDRSFIEGAPQVDEHHISDEEQDSVFAYYRNRNGNNLTTGHGTAYSDDLREEHHDRYERLHDDDASVTLHEEVARVGTRESDTGARVRLRKHVRTEQETVTVPVTHEEVRVERTPLEGHEVSDHAFGKEETAEVHLREEEVVVDKDVVAKEEVSLGTEIVTENVSVPVEVQKEEVTIERTDGGDLERTDPHTDRRIDQDRLEDHGHQEVRTETVHTHTETGHESLGDKIKGVFGKGDNDHR